jgi:hypothetical protein
MARRIEKTSGKVGRVVFFGLGDKNHTRTILPSAFALALRLSFRPSPTSSAL